jgi:hypothetical protein
MMSNLIIQKFFKMEVKHGGKREGAGRKPKTEEQNIIEQMDSIMELSDLFTKLSNNINNGETKAIELWLKYRVGLPKQIIDSNVNIQTEFGNPFERMRENHGLNEKTNKGD